MTNIKSYSELLQFNTLKERFEYLKLPGEIGRRTFGSERYLNQLFYNSPEWKAFRKDILIRDDGNNMGLIGYPIKGSILLHHINPISIDDIKNRNLDVLLNPENVISVSFKAHQAIHYGDFSLIDTGIIERRPNDTCPWKEASRI
jgi:hypothetical protein